VNLALAIASKDKRVNDILLLTRLIRVYQVALLDADIYGPSVPTLMNLKAERPEVDANNRMIPLSNYGIKCNSMGFLVEEDSAMIWRGPMVRLSICMRDAYVSS